MIHKQEVYELLPEALSVFLDTDDYKGYLKINYETRTQYIDRTVDKYIDNNVVVFSKIDIMMVAVLLLAKRYDLLAKNFVNIGNRFASEEAVIAFLKERTARFAN